MEKIKVICKACNKETERAPKEPPKTPKEKKQIHFICPACGAKNLRDGTAIYNKAPAAAPKEPPQEPERKPENEVAKEKNKPPEEGPKGSSGFTFFG